MAAGSDSEIKNTGLPISGANQPNVTSAWDRGQALSQVEGDEGVLREMAETFLRECPMLLADCHRALDECNLALLRRITNRLKREMECLHATQALSAVAQLEAILREQDLPRAGEAVHEVERNIACLTRELEKFCDSAMQDART